MKRFPLTSFHLHISLYFLISTVLNTKHNKSRHLHSFMKWVSIHTLIVYQAISWQPSNIENNIYCNDKINGTITQYQQHFLALIVYYESNITFSNCQSLFDTQMIIYDSSQNIISDQYCDGDDCPDTHTLCNNQQINREVFTIPFIKPGIYYIKINGFSSDHGLYVIQTTCYSSITTTSTTTPISNNTSIMISVNQSFICKDLTNDNNIDIIYNVNYTQCINEYCLKMDECVMTNYVNNFKSSTDSRCYIYDDQCEIINTSITQNQIGIKGFVMDKCHSFPTDWVDSFGDNCNQYQLFGWCLNNDVNGNISNKDFENLSDNKYGLSALSVCCECGGGIKNIDNQEMIFTNSINIDLLSNDDLLCIYHENNYILNHREWNNLILYQFCIELQQKYNKMEVDCDIIIDKTYKTSINEENLSIVECDFDQFIFNNQYDNNNTNSLYFILIIAMDHQYENVIYLNSEWFDINQFLLSPNIDYISNEYQQCLIELNNGNFDMLYGILPCNNDNTNNDNFTFKSTQMYTTELQQTDLFDNSLNNTNKISNKDTTPNTS